MLIIDSFFMLMLKQIFLTSIIIIIIMETLLSVKKGICYTINEFGKQGIKIRPVTYVNIHITVLLNEIL